MSTFDLVSFPAAEPHHVEARLRAAKACAAFNALSHDADRLTLFKAWAEVFDLDIGDEGNLPLLLSHMPSIKGPLTVKYGTYIRIGSSSFINSGCSIRDNPMFQTSVSIGERCVISTNVQIHTITRPLHPTVRQGGHGPSLCAPVYIGDDVYIGDGAIILPGVHIGEGGVVSAGSVVTENVPAGHLVAGNPARIVRKVSPSYADHLGLQYDEEGEVVAPLSDEFQALRQAITSLDLRLAKLERKAGLLPEIEVPEQE